MNLHHFRPEHPPLHPPAVLQDNQPIDQAMKLVHRHLHNLHDNLPVNQHVNQQDSHRNNLLDNQVLSPQGNQVCSHRHNHRDSLHHNPAANLLNNPQNNQRCIHPHNLHRNQPVNLHDNLRRVLPINHRNNRPGNLPTCRNPFPLDNHPNSLAGKDVVEYSAFLLLWTLPTPLQAFDLFLPFLHMTTLTFLFLDLCYHSCYDQSTNKGTSGSSHLTSFSSTNTTTDETAIIASF